MLAMLGAVALRRRWSAWAILTLGLGLWLFTMAVVMPLTDAGFFAVDLVDGTAAAVGGYLAVALTYSATLAGVARRLGPGRAGPQRDGRSIGVAPSRRSALLLAGSAVASFAGTVLAVQLGVGRRARTEGGRARPAGAGPVRRHRSSQATPGPGVYGAAGPGRGTASRAHGSAPVRVRIPAATALPEPPRPARSRATRTARCCPAGRPGRAGRAHHRQRRLLHRHQERRRRPGRSARRTGGCGSTARSSGRSSSTTPACAACRRSR